MKITKKKKFSVGYENKLFATCQREQYDTVRYGRGVLKVHDLGTVAYDRDLTSNYQRVDNFEFQNQHESK